MSWFETHGTAIKWHTRFQQQMQVGLEVIHYVQNGNFKFFNFPGASEASRNCNRDFSVILALSETFHEVYIQNHHADD